MTRYLTGLFLLFLACNPPSTAPTTPPALPQKSFLQVLGIAQDAGFPQMDCRKDCCKRVWNDPSLRRKVSCLGIVDPKEQTAWIIDATPDFKDQWQELREQLPNLRLGGILLTHAHIGHYTGLMQLGREVMGTKEVAVYTMPRMRQFLTDNGPWSQLVNLGNIKLYPIESDSIYQLSPTIQFRPFLVPHRDEYSETVGYEIIGASKSGVFIPDIDKWNVWEQDIRTVVKSTDIAFLDGSFFQNGEIPGRDMSEIPHPFVEESMALLGTLGASERSKVHFTHFNHTNPMLNSTSKAHQDVLNAGFQIAKEMQTFELD